MQENTVHGSCNQVRREEKSILIPVVLNTDKSKLLGNGKVQRNTYYFFMKLHFTRGLRTACLPSTRYTT